MQYIFDSIHPFFDRHLYIHCTYTKERRCLLLLLLQMLLLLLLELMLLRRAAGERMRVAGIDHHAQSGAHTAVVLEAQQSGCGGSIASPRTVAMAVTVLLLLLLLLCVVMERLQDIVDRLLVGIEAHRDGRAAAQARRCFDCGCAGRRCRSCRSCCHRGGGCG